MRIVKIKNLQDESDTYCGQTIGSEQYYQLQNENELCEFANNAKVINHHASTPQKILINNGTDDLNFTDGKKCEGEDEFTTKRFTTRTFCFNFSQISYSKNP